VCYSALSRYVNYYKERRDDLVLPLKYSRFSKINYSMIELFFSIVIFFNDSL